MAQESLFEYLSGVALSLLLPLFAVTPDRTGVLVTGASTPSRHGFEEEP